jgi:hypothetical protein
VAPIKVGINIKANKDATSDNGMVRPVLLRAFSKAIDHLLRSFAVPSDGSLSPDSCRSRRMPMMAALGHIQTFEK